MPILIAAVGLLGLVVGPFLNVVIDRVPRGASVVPHGSPREFNQRLAQGRAGVLSIGRRVRRERCDDNTVATGVRRGLIALGTSAMFVVVTLQVAHLHQLGALPAYLFFTAVGIALSVIDLDVRRLPNAIVYPSYLVLAALLTLSALVGGNLSALGRAGTGAGALFVGFLLLAVAYPGGMGLGDVKLAGIVGGVLGYLSYSALLVGAFAAFILGGLVSAVLLLSGRADRKSAIPFGPAMLLGAGVAIFATDPLAAAYLHLVHRA